MMIHDYEFAVLGLASLVALRVVRWVRARRRLSVQSAHSNTVASSNWRGATEGGVYYRTKDGRADYAFSFERIPSGGYRAYIASQPSYGGRETNFHATHRLMDGSRLYVCWTDELRTEEDARKVAALWADSTQEYIRCGRGF